MNEQHIQDLLETYLDNELSAPERSRVAQHLETCASCAAAFRRLQALSGTIQRDLQFDMPPEMAARVSATVRHATADSSPRLGQRPMLAAAMLLGAVLGGVIWWGASSYLPTESGRPVLAETIVSAHVASLMADHLTDVSSSDRHAIKPWFSGKLAYSPPVKDVSASGFPLVGARLDYVGGRAVSVFAYRRRGHVINLFVWPAAGGGPGAPASESRRGFNMARWKEGEFEFWAISDVAADDLRLFVTSLRTHR